MSLSVIYCLIFFNLKKEILKYYEDFKERKCNLYLVVTLRLFQIERTFHHKFDVNGGGHREDIDYGWNRINGMKANEHHWRWGNQYKCIGGEDTESPWQVDTLVANLPFGVSDQNDIQPVGILMAEKVIIGTQQFFLDFMVILLENRFDALYRRGWLITAEANHNCKNTFNQEWW